MYIISCTVGLFISEELKKIVRYQFNMQIIFLEQYGQEREFESLYDDSKCGYILLDKPAKEYEESLRRIILKTNEYVF